MLVCSCGSFSLEVQATYFGEECFVMQSGITSMGKVGQAGSASSCRSGSLERDRLAPVPVGDVC